MDEQLTRPFDALNKAKGRRVVVESKNGKQYIGILDAFDPHINMVLKNAEEYVPEEVEREVAGGKMFARTGNMVLKRKLGTVFLRGDTITIISTE